MKEFSHWKGICFEQKIGSLLSKIIKKNWTKKCLFKKWSNKFWSKNVLIENSFDCFEVIILEVSLHEYNKWAPLFIDIINYMREKNYVLYDLFDFKRLGNQNSYLLQFDCIFVRQNSDLLRVNFWFLIYEYHNLY